MYPQRLPIVDGDDGVWGDILRKYLEKEHFNDDTDNAANGGHKNVTIRAGTAGAGGAPLKFTSGTLLTTPEAGAMEFAGDNLYITQTSGTTRKKIATYDDSAGATGDLYYRNGSGYFTRLAIGTASQILTVSGGVPTWQTPTTAPTSFADGSFTLQNTATPSKQAKFNLTNITASTTRTFTLPDANTTLVGTDTTQALTNKTIDANGTGNSITNLEVADFATGVIDTDLTTVSGSDDTIPSAKAAKSYTDTAIAAAQTVSVNLQTGTSYTFVLSDASKVVECSNASAITLSVPPNSSVAFPVGTVIEICQMGTGAITIAPGSGVTLRSADTLITRTQYSTVSLRKRATDEWIVVGDTL